MQQTTWVLKEKTVKRCHQIGLRIMEDFVCFYKLLENVEIISKTYKVHVTSSQTMINIV